MAWTDDIRVEVLGIFAEAFCSPRCSHRRASRDYWLRKRGHGDA
jgi:hypothetical protein